MFYGIDVSDNNSIDLRKIRNENDIVYIKATEGRSYVNKTLDKQYQQAKDAGYKIGFYHYAWNHPEEESKFFNSVISKYQYDLMPCIDIEEPSIKDSLDSDDYIQRFSKEFGGVDNMLIYTGLSYYHSKINRQYNANMWIAAYGQVKPTLKDNKLLMWQYTDKAYGVTDRSEIYQIPYKNGTISTNNNVADTVIDKTNNIGNEERYVDMKKFYNGSTRENIYSSNKHDNLVGYLDPGEVCDCLGTHNGHAIVMYDASNGYSKIGFTESTVWPGCIK